MRNNPHLSPYDRTEAVRNLIETASDYTHVVVSLTRVTRPNLRFDDVYDDGPIKVIALGYFGLPYGLGLRGEMRRVARRVKAVLAKHNISPDIVHSHTLAFDGLAGAALAKTYNVPHVASVRGESDFKVVRKLPHLRAKVRQIYRDAAHVFYVSAWAREEMEQRLCARSERTDRLPNITKGTFGTRDADAPVTGAVSARTADQPLRVITVLRLDAWEKKRLHVLLNAVASRPDLNIELEIVGGGRAPGIDDQIKGLIDAAGIADKVSMSGQVTQSEVVAKMRDADIFALVSVNETFGMVYVEALASGIPVVFTRGTGIDGYIAHGKVGLGVPSDDAEALANAIEEIATSLPVFRTNVAAAQDELQKMFLPANISQTYQQALAQALVAKA